MFELLVVDNNAWSSRVRHQGVTYYPKSFKPGLELALTKAFQSLLGRGVLRMEIKADLIPGARSFDHLVTISNETLIWIDSGLHSFEGLKGLNWVYADFLDSLSSVIGLLAWQFASPKERFQAGSLRSVSRMCVFCKETQVRERSGQSPNMSLGEEWGWPAGCSNPKCFSHDIERMINPAYEVPREGLENMRLTTVMQEAVRVAIQNPGAKC